MKIKNILSSSYVGWLVIFAAIILWYLFYFFSYIPNQEAKLKKRGFRILEEYSSNMIEKHQYYENHFRNFGPFYYLRDTQLIKAPKSKTQKAIKIAIDALNESIIRINKSDSSLFKMFNGIPSFCFSGVGDDESFIVPVETFMEGLKFDRLFESIVFFDSAEVFYSSESDIATNITNTEAIADSAVNRQGGFVHVINVRGEKKHALILPFDFADKRFFLAGLISHTAFKSKTRSINFQLLILISGLLLVLLVGMPVLKILLIDAYDHLDASDPHRVTVSLIVATGILAIISLGSTYHKLIDRKHQKDRLKIISESIYHQISDDVKKVLHFSDSVLPPRDSAGLLPLVDLATFDSVKTEKIFDLNELILIDKKGKAGIVFSVEKKQNLSVDTTIILGTETLEIDTLDLSTRQYFSNAADVSKSWFHQELKRYFFLQSITSYNTGYKEAAVSFLAEPQVFALTAPIPSLFHHILPDDVEFAVIDPYGEVLFHSVQSKNLHENFLDECGMHSYLKNAVKLRMTETERVDYNEKPWLIRLKPLENTPLTLVTLLDIKKMQQRNTRVILFTFYFFSVTLICILIWMLLLKAIRPQTDKVQTESWLFNWIHFDLDNQVRYRHFFIILWVIVLMELVALFFIRKPVEMLVYQLIFILFTGIAGAVLLGKTNFSIEKYYKKEQIPQLILVLLLLILMILLVRLNWKQVFPILVLPAIGWYILSRPKEENPEDRKDLINKMNDDEFAEYNRKIRNLYNFSLFLWILSLSFIPVMQYYLSIQNQEEYLLKRNLMFQLAEKSLELASTVEYDQQFISYSGFDGLTFEYNTNPAEHLDSVPKERDNEKDLLPVSDRIYSLLSDPLTLTSSLSLFLKDNSAHYNWYIKNDKLHFYDPLKPGFVTVKKEKLLNIRWSYWLYLLLPIVIIALFLWFVLVYITENVLYTKQEKDRKTQAVSLKEIVLDESRKRIVINCFNVENLKQEIRSLFKDNQEESGSLLTISATMLLEEKFDLQKLVTGKNKAVLIPDLNQCLGSIQKHDLLFDRLYKINFATEGKVILLNPFETEYLREWYDENLKLNKSNAEIQAAIVHLKQTWNSLLRDYENIYVSRLSSEEDSEKEEHGRKKLFYSFIWNNLSRYEKLVLYDLADDGLINLKNKRMINLLIKKGLIKDENYLLPYSSGFKYFINHSVPPDEKKMLKSSASLKGMWQTLRYPIIAVLIVIAAFIFISQGYSFEKVTAIFAGVLTLMATMTKLFEGN